MLIVSKGQSLQFKFTFIPDVRESLVTSIVSKDISRTEITASKATITTSSNHGFSIGQAVTISGANTKFNGLHTVYEIPSLTTFSYRTIESDSVSAVTSGVVTVQKSLLNSGISYDPIASGSDVTVSVYRGVDEFGANILSPISYLQTTQLTSPNAYITRNGSSEFIFHYTVPQNIEAESTLFSGIYTVIASTFISGNSLSAKIQFELKDSIYNLSASKSFGNKSASITYKPSYDDLNQSNIQSILLLGHADGLELNNPVKISSIQNAIDLLSADKNSPLLRGVFDAYGAGARSIFICAVAPMSEYVANVNDRNNGYLFLGSNSVAKTFYEKYYERLCSTYSVIKDLDFIDVVVPLEVSFIKTGGVDFLSQLVHYCNDFHNETGYVQIGIIGTRGNGISSDDINLIENNKYLSTKYTTYTNNGAQIASDIGRYVMPVYGEALFSHSQIDATYTGSLSAAVAGMIVKSDLNMGLTRKRIPGAMSLYGADLSSFDLRRLDILGINTAFRGVKSRRGNVYEVYLTSDYTLSSLNSTFSKIPQMRLTSYVISQVEAYSQDSLGKFGYDRVVSNVINMLKLLKSNGTLVDFEFKAEEATNEKGAIIFYINLTSSLGLKRINLSLSAGPAA